MLTVVALPIGDRKDITLRALELLKSADIIIGEEHRELIPLLKHHDIDHRNKKIELLNEHSSTQDLDFLRRMCGEHNVVLVSDCGTPVFCDPGSQLIKLCRQNGIKVKSAPGASSLMTLLSLSSEKLDKFYFYGFLPREKEERQKEIQRLSKIKEPTIVMDTPYRLKATVEQLSVAMPKRKSLLGCDLTQETERVLEGTLLEINSQISADQKAEFVLLIY